MGSIAVKGGKVYAEGYLVEANLLVEDGKIKAITKEDVKGDINVKAEGRLVLPGAIDVHAHINDPGYLYREDFESASKAALIGGMTTFVEMPLVKDIDDEASFKERKEMGERASYIDFGIHAGFMREKNYNRIEELSKMGLKTFKVFTCRPFRAPDEQIIRMLEASRKTGSMLLFHAEDEAILDYYFEKYSDRRDQLCVHDARPAEAEALAIEKVATYAKLTGGKAHIVHLSSKLGVEAIISAKKSGADISSETCPHYLVFTKKDAEKLGPYLKMAPSLKEEKDRLALWEALEKGYVEIVTTDHAPGTKEEKNVGYSDPWKAWGGVPGVATMFPVLFTYGYIKGLISLSSLVKAVSVNPARRFGIAGKGFIAVGNDADIIIVDPNKEIKFDGSKVYKVGWSPYDGMSMRGFPEHVIAGGEIAVQDYQFVGKTTGKFIYQKPS
ncbi:MAG: dihydroorotase family protein [Conexivisphaerales archaeon]|nr:dihydroorotase family protein [Conexivisphaerales archaeon]